MSDIKIVGLAKNVVTMSDIVAVELKNIEKEQHEKKEQTLLAKAIHWMYEDANNKWLKFDPPINKVGRLYVANLAIRK